MSFVKAKLKAARDAIGKKDFVSARDAASSALEYEPDNYNANVFLGLASLELKELDQSEQAYKKAIDSAPEQLLAWQGISKFYERTEKWEKYAETLLHLAGLHSRSNDGTKCGEAVQKLVDLRKERGTRQQLVEALKSYLEDSELYSVLSTLPPPDPTNPTATTTYDAQTAVHNTLTILEEIVTLLEKEEAESSKREIDKRRMRLGAPSLVQITKDVKRELSLDSQLPHLYHLISSHPNASDELRRAVDAKLLRHKHELICSLPNSTEHAKQKAVILSEFTELVDGIIILRIPDELAWSIHLEWTDTDTIEGYNFRTITQYMELFPSKPLSRLFLGYFRYANIEIELPEEILELDSGDEDPFDTILAAQNELPDSIIATRVVGEIYVQDKDFAFAIDAAQRGLELVKRSESDFGKRLEKTRIGFKAILATAFVHYFSPKHHARALPIIQEVLEKAPENVSCLMGRAFILQASKKWKEAAQGFSKVVELGPEEEVVRLHAAEELAWCRGLSENPNQGIDALKVVLEQYPEDWSADRARCLWRIGKCYWNLDGEARSSAFEHFIASLKADSAYAPAFTSLGMHYAEFADPPDPTRALKCFQKAFELDAGEAEAARRLAEGFADEGEWSLVEVVAKRTIEGEGGLDAGLKSTVNAGVPSRYLPTNAWAWRALGVAEITSHNYPAAIQAFQVALRADTDDHVSWSRLGEAYSKAGRYVAALKALRHALELQPDNWMCMHAIGEVHRQASQFAEAITAFDDVLLKHPSEVGVLLAKAQTLLDLGRHELATAFAARAEQSFAKAVEISLKTVEDAKGFRGISWKIIGDAFYMLSRSSSFYSPERIKSIALQVVPLVSVTSNDPLSKILVFGWAAADEIISSDHTLEVALAAYNHRQSLGLEGLLRASALFDLGTALWTWTLRFSDNGKVIAKEKVGPYFLDALRADPGNDVYWNGLGTFNFSDHPKAAQHAYIKALEIDSKNVGTWTNLGLLYLYHGDTELANEALYRAQTLDPDYTLAWIGQALVALTNGHQTDSESLLEHAVSLNESVPLADIQYASQAFQKFCRGSVTRADALLPVFFILDRYLKRKPRDAYALHLHGLICEQLGLTETATELVRAAIAILEAAYEETESAEVERQFAIANSNLARLLMGRRDYDGALQAFESTLGLLQEDDKSEETQLLRVHGFFGSGFAHFKLGDHESALSMLETALQHAGDDSLLRGQVNVLLSQVMWGIGTEEMQESAKAGLLECITTDAENLNAITVLGAMGILTSDDSLVDAALSEVLSLPLDRRQARDPRRDVDYILVQHHIGLGLTAKASTIAQRALFVDPASAEARGELAKLLLQMRGHETAAMSILGGGSSSMESAESTATMLCLRAVGEARTSPGEGRASPVARAQKAVMLTPWKRKPWLALAYASSCRVGE
ncbi:hypothetical protein HGRIS_002250 [Hohenbuehelia grisea]|uniref:Superkiller protein 3 n=1 Tax=Hohenbuehelia grisea TaxID=104357 RepID=A0ABR3JLY7_9AGAR